ncbi:hypothetical protein CCR75_008338 [Bremia lactucae]|uniref:Uncharacterized protein n=1 Tax=Bremia lactucae TaxID=4779 RepID=A0A976FQF2_BRELC|nr:hypothetical protein CCR75_008338 [Bremia lactucae]
MNVYVFGFPAALQDSTSTHIHAMMPAYLTAGIKFQMTVSFLSAPCFSEGSVVCTEGGGMTHQYQLNALPFTGLFKFTPSESPSMSPSWQRKKQLLELTSLKFWWSSSNRNLEVQRFSLDSDACWYSSFDLAIFKIVAPRSNNLIRCEVSLAYVDRMNVYVFGFPAALQDSTSTHTHAMMPAYLTAGIKFQMTVSFLSAPCFSEGSVVCTEAGVLVGFIGGILDGSRMTHQYQLNALPFTGLLFKFTPSDSPSMSPSI